MDTTDLALLDRLRSTLELLELLDADREVLTRMPEADRERFHHLIAQIYNPDPVARRLKLKVAAKERTALLNQRVEAVRDETGIRSLRRKPVFTTPNVYPPKTFAPHDIHVDEPAPRESVEPQH